MLELYNWFKNISSVLTKNYDVSSLSAGHLYAHFHSPFRRRLPRVHVATESKTIKINKSPAFLLSVSVSFSVSHLFLLSLYDSKLFSTKASAKQNKNNLQTHDGALGEKVWATKLFYPVESGESFTKFSTNC